MVSIVNNSAQPRRNQQQPAGDYTVKRGDTLFDIAKRHGVSLQDLLKANPQFTQGARNPNLIFPGEQVKIPPRATAPREEADSERRAPTHRSQRALPRCAVDPRSLRAPEDDSVNGQRERGLSRQVMNRAKQIGDEINRSGGYRFDGVNDGWGFVRRVMDPLLKARGLAPLPTADAGTAAGRKNWGKITDWSKIPVGTPLATHQGHAWGAQWHGGIFAGMKDGVPYIYDNSGSGNAQLRPLPREGYFSFFHKPSAALLG